MPILLLTAALIFSIAIFFYFVLNRKRGGQVLPQGKKLFPRLSHHEELKLISVISSLSDGLIVVDNKLNPWIVNTAARSFLGLTRENPNFYDIASPFPRNLNLAEKVKDAINYNRTTTLHEVQLGDRTFQVFIASIGDRNMTHFATKEGLYSLGASILLQDISTEKSLEKMKEDFAHVIIHELRAPVAAIKNSASLLIAGGISDDEKKKILEIIHTQSEKLLTQISYFLDAGRLEEGKLILNKTQGDIAKVVKEGVDLFLPEAKRKRITLTAEIGNDLPFFYFDNNRIVEAVNNLLSNSLKYTNDFGIVKITADTDDNYNATGSGNVVISVSDNGVGIPRQKQGLLFTKFSQVQKEVSAETQKASSGLGLYITKGIIEAHGGHISVNSTEGKGTIVTFTLPINSQADDASIQQVTSSSRPVN